MRSETALERRFWRFWLMGLLLLAVQIVMNVWLITDIAPLGISDHQAAATAARVDAIQSRWMDAGVMNLAVISMAVDLLYIAVYSWGAFAGGQIFAASTMPALARIGKITMMATLGYCLTDYAETICQFVQASAIGGNDDLAWAAATVRPIKSVLFLLTFFAILLALAVRRRTRRMA